MKKPWIVTGVVAALLLGVAAAGWSRVAPAASSIPTAPLQKGALDIRVNALGDLRVWRGRRRHEFDHHDCALLDLIEPAFVAARKRCSGRNDAAWTHGLSARERQVALCVGRGLTDKQIARELDGPAGSDRRLLAIGLALEPLFGRLPPPAR